MIVDEIAHLSNQEQSEIIADKIASIQNGYQALQKEDITVPPFTENKYQSFSPHKCGFFCQDWIQTNPLYLGIFQLNCANILRHTLLSL